MIKRLSLVLVIGIILPLFSSCKISRISNNDVLQTSEELSIPNDSPSVLTKAKANQSQKSLANSLVTYENNDMCGMFQTKKYPNDFITARHCVKKRFKSDSPVLKSSGKAVRLSKPKLGKATIVTKHFDQGVGIKIKIVKVNQCQAFFVIPKTRDPIVNYIQSGDSGSPVFQYDNKKNPLVIGALSGGFLESKIRDQEDARDAFRSGSMVYDDCNKYF